jgi:hypothetical protein
MKKQRNDMLATEELYQDETLQGLAVEHLHTLSRDSIERCKSLVEPLGQRFNNLKSQTALQRKEEASWLMEALDLWFTKKWNDKRSAEIRRNGSPRKKKAQFCVSCHDELHCVKCEDLGSKVCRLCIPPSDMG